MSETDFLKLKKHDNVETNTEKFDIDNYLNGNWDKINENAKKVNTDISNINSKNTEQDKSITEIKNKDTEQNSKIVELQTEKAELEKELKEAQEDFYQNSIRGQASGEYIHVEDSSNCRAKIGISGNSEQETREGYNQFKTNTSSRTVNGVTVTKNNDSSISFSGTTTAGFTVQLVNYNDLEVTKKMYLRNYGTLENANFIVQLIRSGKTSVEYVPIRPDVTLNAGDIIQKIYVQQQLTGKTVSGTLDILLTDYENKDKGYEQYGVMPSPDYRSEIKAVGSQGSFKIIKSNKNLFNANDIVFSNAWTIIKNGSEVLVAEGVGNFEWKGWNNYINSLIDKYKIISYGIFSEKRTNTENIFNWSDGVAKAIHFNTIYTTKEGKSEGVWVRNDLKLSNETLKIIVGIGDISTYMQHDEQSYIMPVQQEMLEGDYFDFENEEEVHVWKKYEATGNENWITSSSDFSSEKIYSAYLTISDMKEKSKIYCTHFKNIIDTTKQYIFVPYSNILVTGISKDIASDVTGFKNYLKSQYDAGTPVVVYYKLETPNRLKFTDEQKVVAKELKNVRTYKKVTNITTDSKAILDLDYAKDLETLLNNTQALAVNNASEGV